MLFGKGHWGAVPESVVEFVEYPVSHKMVFSAVISIKDFKDISFEKSLLSGDSDSQSLLKKYLTKLILCQDIAI